MAPLRRHRSNDASGDQEKKGEEMQTGLDFEVQPESYEASPSISEDSEENSPGGDQLETAEGQSSADTEESNADEQSEELPVQKVVRPKRRAVIKVDRTPAAPAAEKSCSGRKRRSERSEQQK